MKQLYPHRACIKSQQRIDAVVREQRTNLCLHAKTLSLPHPITGDIITFDSPPPF